MTKKSNAKSHTKVQNAKSKAKAKKPAEQLEIPGAERKVIKAVEEAADLYREARDARMQLTEDESAAQAALADAMQTHGVKVYKYKDSDGVPFTVSVDAKVKVRVRKDQAPKGED